ncbi:MAG: PDZ domain-containing protein [Lentimicrobiaceae bacterium]|nr:PDZ domain-containing protein [Lentimicrobiaceae bacterium]MBR3914998.1 trypsin-like peptidase domain-containing protein [Bacteroidales bacterium]
MKSKTKVLFVTLSVVLLTLSIFTVKLSLSQREMKQSLAEAQMMASTKTDNQAPMIRAAYMPNGENDSFVDAAANTVNTVVHIRTEIITKGSSYYDFFGYMLEQLYGGQLEVPNNVSVGYGSGVVISPDGYIVTNNHVVEGASKIEVTFNDKHKRTATIIGNDPSTDLALIKVDAQDLEYLTFADSDEVRVGEWVLAVGNPFNLTSTVTAGIVSAKARNINILGDGSTIESFIQTDAAINPGNSGGALVDMDGNLIGINAAIASRTGSYEGYSFAIPSNIVKKVVEDFLQYGALQRAYLGVSIVEITEELAEEKGITEMSGVYIMAVEERGGAKAAGIKEDDVILSINGISVNSNSQLIGVVSQYRPGDKVKVKIQRRGEVMEKIVTLKNLEGTEEMHKEGEGFYNEVLGIKLQPLPASLKSELGINYGLKIVEIKEGIFKQKGITDEFIILSVNHQRVSSENDLKKALSNDRNGKVRIEGTNMTGTYNITFEFYR